MVGGLYQAHQFDVQARIANLYLHKTHSKLILVYKVIPSHQVIINIGQMHCKLALLVLQADAKSDQLNTVI